MAGFELGDKVEVLDEAIEGIVTAIEGTVITLETKDGFPLQFPSSQLIKSGRALNVGNYEAFQAKKEKESPEKKKIKVPKPKERNAPKMEVDLHIHQLTNSTRGMTNFDMLNLQVETAKRQLEFAIDKRIQKVVFIHGVGEGILKEELNYLFKKYPVDFYDAEYQKYGLGATEVYIYQNS
ncbi:DNA mismatch repair protein MutS [Muricauda sp. SCSIO 64092]|uniref:Smr/MutS family protein n=1 Tax=Allomuricauda sp. SCSIO 64092 TaxID=2908842 RepID=UPI001FF15298|nr:Smr/MutS family protein [Muricauda sp. SCSIO 64092]UOY05979.1 DNA mismatch repair protein MutS [Muricauda sp. SCSIO 64092]